MNLTTTEPAENGVFGSPYVSLEEVSRESGQLFALVAIDLNKHGPPIKRWLVPCKPRDLQTWKAFQRLLAQRAGIWARHESQDDANTFSVNPYYPPSWEQTVRLAFEMGVRS